MTLKRYGNYKTIIVICQALAYQTGLSYRKYAFFLLLIGDYLLDKDIRPCYTLNAFSEDRTGSYA